MPRTAVAEVAAPPKPAAGAVAAAPSASDVTGATISDGNGNGADGDAVTSLPKSSSSLHRSVSRLEHALETARLEAQTHRRRSTAFGVAVLLLGAALAAGHYGDSSAGRAARASLTQTQAKFESAVRSAVDHSAVLGRLNVTLGEVAQNLRSALGDDESEVRVGQALRARGARPKHPVVVVPGFVTSGLELWEGRPCAKSFFRQRLWGTLSMASTLLQNRTCWIDHLSLDPKTGSDPPGVRLRAAKGLEAVDNFLASYWVFSKLFQAMGDVGYDSNFMVAVPYDWRLALPVLQRRDGYFSRLKAEVELLRSVSAGQKAVLVSHSFGGVVTLTFLEWVERAEKGWTERNVHAWANLAAPLLGLPKALAPLVSGESRETADMMQGMAFLVESYLSRTRRAGMFRSWGSLQAMLPVGGPKVWGSATSAPDDPPELREAGRSLGALLLARDDRASSAGRLGASATAHLEAELERHQKQQQEQELKKKKKRRSLLSSLSFSFSSSGGEEGEEQKASGNDGGAGAASAAAASGDGSKNGSSPSSSSSSSSDGQPQSQSLLEVPLDVDAALRFVGRMAGPDFVGNMPLWAGAARRLDLVATLREAQEEAAARAELVHEHEEEQEEAKGQKKWRGGKKEDGSCSAGGGDGGGGSDGGDGAGSCDAPGGDEAQHNHDQEDDDDNIDVGTSGRSPHGNSTRANAMSQAAASLETFTRAFNALLGYGGGGGGGGAVAAPSGLTPSAVGREGGSSDSATADARAAGADGPAPDSPSAAADAASSSSSSSPPPPPPKDLLADAGPPGPPVRALDSTVTPLPKAPSLRVYCLYGTGSPTERAYHYAREPGGLGRWAIDTSRNDEATSLDSGVQLADGDGTVPLISNGALCEGGWRTRRLNPSGSRVVVREYEHEPVPAWVDARGGPKASSHVELLGHGGLMEDVLRIATGFEEGEVTDRYHSRIREIAAAIPWNDL